MVAGLEEISSGTISIDDRVVNEVPPKDRDIAMVFQNYALYPHLSVYDNLAFGLKLRKFPRAEIDARVREAATMLGLDAMLDRKPKALSGGQRQRVAVGRAIVRKPKVFLFDEPLSNLDAKMRVAMRTEIARLHNRHGVTVIYVTHDQVEAMTMGDRICAMKDGAIMQLAEPLELYNQPANLFVAGFIGSPPMNLFRGTVVLEHEKYVFTEKSAGAGGISLMLDERLGRVAAPHLGRPLCWVSAPKIFRSSRSQASRWLAPLALKSSNRWARKRILSRRRRHPVCRTREPHSPIHSWPVAHDPLQPRQGPSLLCRIRAPARLRRERQTYHTPLSGIGALQRQQKPNPARRPCPDPLSPKVSP